MRRMLNRRVVVTGLGLVTPLGTGVEKNWEALTAGRSGVGPITKFDASQFPVRFAGEVKDFIPEDWIEKRDVKKMDPFIQYVYAAAHQAMLQSKYTITDENADAFGVITGNGIGGLTTVEETHKGFWPRSQASEPVLHSLLISNLGLDKSRSGMEHADRPSPPSARVPRQPRNRRSVQDDKAGAARWGNRGRYRSSGYSAGCGRIHRDAGVVHSQ